MRETDEERSWDGRQWGENAKDGSTTETMSERERERCWKRDKIIKAILY